MKNEPFTPPARRDQSDGPFFRADRLLLVPPLLAGYGLIGGEDVALAFALILWQVGYLVWSAWIAWCVVDQVPRGDVWRTAALLVYGGVPMLLAPLPGFLIGGKLGAAFVFLTIFAGGFWAIMGVLDLRPAPLPPRTRARLLWGATAICGLWATAGTVGAAASLRHLIDAEFDGIVLGVASFVAIGGAGLGVLLARSALRGFTPHRPLTAEAILGETPAP